MLFLGISLPFKIEQTCAFCVCELHRALRSWWLNGEARFRTIGKILNHPAKRAKVKAEAELLLEQEETEAKEQLEPQRSSGESSGVGCALQPLPVAEDNFMPEDVIQACSGSTRERSG